MQSPGRHAGADAAGASRGGGSAHRGEAAGVVAGGSALERLFDAGVALLSGAAAGARSAAGHWHVSAGGGDRAGASAESDQAGAAVARALPGAAAGISERSGGGG